MNLHLAARLGVLLGVALALPGPALAGPPTKFLEAHCHACHDANTKSGGLDLAALKFTPADADNFATWVKVHDRVAAGEMPPKAKPRPPAADTAALTRWLHDELVAAERKAATGGTRLRRLTRGEYENTVRDLFDLPSLPLQNDLPADGQVDGFDKNADALDLSHVNLAKYLEAADRALDMAVATRPRAPTPIKQRVSLANPSGFVAHVLMNGDGVLLKDKKPDPHFPPAGEHGHIDQGAHERMGAFRSGATVGLFRHEDESFSPYFNEFVAVYPGRYRLTTSLWSFQWDKGQVLPARGTEAARLSVVQLVGDGRGGGHPSTVLGHYDAPSMTEKTHVVTTWLNPRETIGFNTASLAPAANYFKKKRAMEFTGPAVACDYLDVEGPFHDAWPPPGHRRLFGGLPLAMLDPKSGVRPPPRQPDRQQLFMAKNKADPVEGTWTVFTANPFADADRLLADFLPRAFRRPVPDAVRAQYAARVAERLKAGDCFEVAMRWAYRAALSSPDFLYHVEPAGELDPHALACRLSYFLWHSAPDDALRQRAADGSLRKPDVLRGEVERLLRDDRSQRFVEDFVGQWLKLRQIAANDADRKLYPEFSKYLQDSMVAETHAYFRELIDKNLTADRLVKSDFALLNEKLAAHYGVPGVSGSQVRRVQLPPGSPRGGFLTQASVLKVTANGTTTSPVPRGAFVMDRLLGQPPAPPPPNIPAVEPDVRGATTIREQLAKHRADASCAACHAKMDPPGFALEEFDVIGGQRTRYRSLGAGDPAPRGAIDPFIGIGFKLGPKVDASGELPDGRTFAGVSEFQTLLAANRDMLLANLARQFAVYATGRGVSFADRDEVAAIVAAANKGGGGVRTLIHELVQSRLFRTK